jgi:hypothetical protein
LYYVNNGTVRVEMPLSAEVFAHVSVGTDS